MKISLNNFFQITFYMYFILFSEMSELLFECYHVPQVAYGNDALFSLYKNHPKPGKKKKRSSLHAIYEDH